MFHLVYHDFFQARNLLRDGIEHQFVVDLQHHPAAQSFLADAAVHRDHRQFDDIGRCPLDGRIHRVPFGKGAGIGIAGIDIGQIPPAAEEGLYVAVFARTGNGRFDIGRDGREILEIIIDDLLGSEAGPW